MVPVLEFNFTLWLVNGKNAKSSELFPYYLVIITRRNCIQEFGRLLWTYNSGIFSNVSYDLAVFIMKRRIT